MNITIKQKIQKINNSPVLWLKNFVKIVDNHSEEVHFKVNEQQKDFIKNKQRFNIIGKGRQLGMTTLSLGLMLWTAITKPNKNCIVLSYSGDAVNEVYTKLQKMYESIPEKYTVGYRKFNRHELLLNNGSRITNSTVGTKELGRGSTYSWIHCTEFAFWENEQDTKGLLALEQALAKDKDSCIVIESTANGLSNNYYRLFMNAYKKHSKYKAFFYPWYSDKKQFHDDYIEAETWYKSVNHGHRLPSDDLTPYEQKLYKDGASILQLEWRQWKLLDTPKDQFRQEFPSTPEEMFISSDVGVFDENTITERYNYIPDILSTKEIKELPLSLQVYYGNGLNIYKDVKKTEKYYGGIDVGAGLKGDFSSICILDSSGEQVATFNRNDVPVYLFAKICYDLGYYFNYAMLLPERNTYGLDLITRLRKEMGYIQILKIKRFDKIKGQKIWDYGWYTDNVSKTKMVMDYKEAFETGIVLVNDRDTLDQMRIFQEHNGSFGNEKGSQNHDDLVDSFCLALQSLKSGKSYI
ncbi:terminase large subunit domain-containing protein [Clostridium coskatii]|uniref:Terminase-like family protein n=1 Tax=Clostridium coskatii TaxID=1705578 RepID=A0A168R792_9CLOT|nr:terminase family protein [Clostridium coskatii]OAA90140.1 Terminase-like family protein [Clostridium coskatii]OBR97425.1 terminase-like family protein [Clostridium coskatii]